MAGAGQAYDKKRIGRWCAENRPQKLSIRLERQKHVFAGVGESVGRRRQALAPYTMDPPDMFEVVIYTLWPCPTLSGLAADWTDVEVESLSSHELNFISVFNATRKKQIAPSACSQLKNKNEQNRIIPPLSPSAAVHENIFGYLLKAVLFK